MKTLHFVVRVTVPNDMLEVHLRDRMEKALLGYTVPVTMYRVPFGKLRIWRPRGKLGVLLRQLDG